MKKKLALLLAAAMAVTCLATGCGNGDSNGTSESGTASSGTTEKVDINDLYEKDQYEGEDLSKYLTLGATDGLITIKEEDYTVSDADIQEEIDGYRESYATTTEVEDKEYKVQKGDIVNIDYVGKINGIKFEGGSATDTDLEIGSGTFIDGFEDGLIGTKAGDKIDVKTTFPKDYKLDPDLAGQEAIFTVTVNSISVKTPAEYNDELVSKITNKIYTTTKDFNAYLEKAILTTKETKVLEDFLTALVKKTTFTSELDSVVSARVEENMEYFEKYAEAYKYTLEDFAKAMGFENVEGLRAEVVKDTEDEVKYTLVYYAYAASIGFELSDEQVLTNTKEIQTMYGYESVEDVLEESGAESLRKDAFTRLLSKEVISRLK